MGKNVTNVPKRRRLRFLSFISILSSFFFHHKKYPAAASAGRRWRPFEKVEKHNYLFFCAPMPSISALQSASVKRVQTTCLPFLPVKFHMKYFTPSS